MSAGGPAVPPPTVRRLLVVLAVASGVLDVVCVTRLGGFFASVITGNLVQVGRALAAGEIRAVLGGAVAVGGYAAGVAGGSLALRRAAQGWRRRTAAVATAEVALLVVVTAGWLATDARPGYPAGLALLGAAAAASGTQSALTLGAGMPGASTTYLTGSLTDVVRHALLDPHRVAAIRGGLSRLIGLLAGAACGAVLLRVAPGWAPAPAAVLVAAVLAVVLRAAR
ncbi:YoaK family protein [Micromonospora soli]|uniref:YoaK family protein n=1 Tax=Micromonospora sp. NBRC 110009 TaxID=3061627 RepID=UPI002671F555|nr:YoaK family protein [Micromonospora sp. NBRC 110009]WKT97754.1 YoaK family protein [Micromonospora sp. NBRC 110009]